NPDGTFGQNPAVNPTGCAAWNNAAVPTPVVSTLYAYSVPIGGTVPEYYSANFYAFADINRDRKADLIAKRQPFSTGPEDLFFYLSNGDGTFGTPSTSTWPSEPNIIAPSQQLTIPFNQNQGDEVFADLNGDHRADMIAVTVNATNGGTVASY